MATLRLKFVRESESGKARLYENGDGARHWVPRSVTGSTFKFPPQAGGMAVHDVEINDGWLAKYPWPANKQKELQL